MKKSASKKLYDEMEVIGGIELRHPLKPIFTKCKERVDVEESESSKSTTTTPTCAKSRISSSLGCPPAPKKRKPARSWHYSNYGAVKEFFVPPDLETIFIRRVGVEGA